MIHPMFSPHSLHKIGLPGLRYLLSRYRLYRNLIIISSTQSFNSVPYQCPSHTIGTTSRAPTKPSSFEAGFHWIKGINDTYMSFFLISIWADIRQYLRNISRAEIFQKEDSHLSTFFTNVLARFYLNQHRIVSD